MVTNGLANAAAELNEILKYLPKSEVEKIPLKLRKFFKDIANANYNAKIDPNKSLEQQNISEKTKDLIAVVYREYWCSTEERKALDARLIENDRMYEEQLLKSYNLKKVLENKQSINSVSAENNTAIIEYKEQKWYQKVILTIKSLLKKFYINKSKKDKPQNTSYEDKLLQQFGKNENLPTNHVRLLIITDTHNCLYYDKESVEKIKNAQYDVCLILGDISNSDIIEILKFVPYDKIYGLLGNHDELDRFEESKIRSLNGKVITINGVRIAGLQGSHRYKTGDYGMYTHEESIQIADEMPPADILVSHDRPFIKDNNDNVHDGLKGVTYYCYKNHVKLEIHGHLHEETEEILKNGTKVLGKYKVDVIKI